MKLTELDPRWVGSGGDGISDAQGHPVPRREGIGISFDCPCGCDQPVFVPFENPIDGDESKYKTAWKREGDTFENLTLSPSILRMDGCKWHGFVRNGEIINA